MKRVIKFRAWIKTPKECYMAIQGTPDIEDLQSFMFHYGDKELMQFTGLVDKNKVEIYEGDICTMHMPNTWGDDHELSKKIKNVNVLFEWCFNGWFLKGFNKLNGTYYFGSIKGDMLEVIGNIYDNHELVNGAS